MTPIPRKKIRPTSGFAVAYRRVSTEEQSQSGLGLDAQTTAIKAAAERARFTIRDTFTDAGVSGGLPVEKRPALLAALAALRRGDVLLVAKRDRLSRDIGHAAAIEVTVKRKGARIVSAAGEGTDADDPSNHMMRMLIDMFATYERLVIGSRTSAALQAKAARGERVSRHAPYGYRFTKDDRLEENSKELAIVAIMHDCAAAGFSLDAIARELNRLKHRTRSGKPWVKQYVQNVLQRHTPPEALIK